MIAACLKAVYDLIMAAGIKRREHAK